MLAVLAASSFGFTVLFYWLHALRCRLAAIVARRIEEMN